MSAVMSPRRRWSRRRQSLSDRGRSGALVARPRVVGRGTGLIVGLFLLSWGLMAAPGAQAIPTPAQDPFYAYQGATPLASIAPGTVLKTRTLWYHVVGIPLPIQTIQLLYRSTGQLGQPTVNVTSVLEPLVRSSAPNVVAYESLYDSLNPNDEPSYEIAGGLSLGGLVPAFESVLVAPELLAGDVVVIADTEGEGADFADGPEYGMYTLDSLRAALHSPLTGLQHATKIGILGYSGGAIGAEWS